jgi:GDPmannose 4,6-dehydratase
MKRALITGITGQDGSYLAEFLEKKGYEIYGFMRRSSTDPYTRIGPMVDRGAIKIIYGNMRDHDTIRRALDDVRPDEVYNLAAQSHVAVSFVCAEETFDINHWGVKRILGEIYQSHPHTRFYQASTSELFGTTKPPQNENSPFAPVSPYSEAKLRAHNLVKEYRDKGIFASAGILFNHESPRRGKHFVTRKLTDALCKVKLGLQEHVTLGNLEARRDWGYAGDYVEAMWMMLQQPIADDYVIGTGESHSVRDFVEAVAAELDMRISWEGYGLQEVGRDQDGKVVVRVSEQFYRPTEVDYLLADSEKARRILGWYPRVTFQGLVKMMVQADMERIRRGSEDLHG